jgi:hypothetical protein
VELSEQRCDVISDLLARRRIAAREIVDDLCQGRFPGAALDDLGRDGPGSISPDGKTSSPALPSFAGAARNTITKPNKSKSDPACRSQRQEDFTLLSSPGIIAIIAARLSIKYHPMP